MVPCPSRASSSRSPAVGPGPGASASEKVGPGVLSGGQFSTPLLRGPPLSFPHQAPFFCAFFPPNIPPYRGCTGGGGQGPLSVPPSSLRSSPLFPGSPPPRPKRMPNRITTHAVPHATCPFLPWLSSKACALGGEGVFGFFLPSPGPRRRALLPILSFSPSELRSISVGPPR